MGNDIHTFVILAYKESSYLEKCIKSVVEQNSISKVIIATSTLNTYIQSLANKYNLDLIVNSAPGLGIGYDFDFAISCAKTPLVTVAHQDDIYDIEYANEVIARYQKDKLSTIIFTDYYEIRDEEKKYKNFNLRIKRLLLTPLKSNILSKMVFGKRISLRFGCSICCPAVTFVKENIKSNDIFKSHLKCDVDWFAWEKLSRVKGQFSYISKPLMGHRVHEESTTTEIINDNIRTQEDLFMFKKFWPDFIAKGINKFYIKSEKSNK